MTTLSDVITAAAVDDSPEVTSDRPRVHARMRAREYRSPVVVGKVADMARTAGVDLVSAWWLPASVPTLQRAWAERMPDREKVPGGSGALYCGWVVYNHTVGLAVPAAAVLVVGLLTPLVWAAQHPARLGLAIALITPLIVLLAL